MKISYLELETYRVLILGMLLNAFMVNQVKENSNQIQILENAQDQVQETQSENLRIKTESSVVLQLELIFQEEKKDQLLIIQTMAMNQKLQIYYSHKLSLKWVSLSMISNSLGRKMKSEFYLREQDFLIRLVNSMLCIIELNNLCLFQESQATM